MAQTPEWTPSTHHVVPQPAGQQCADWYQRCKPTAEDILYALAHTKGQRDALLAALESFDSFFEKGERGIEQAMVEGLDAQLIEARAAILLAKQAP